MVKRPKNRLISGINKRLSQVGGNVFRFLAGDLQISGIRAEFDSFVPRDLAVWPDRNFPKFTIVIPQRKNTASGKRGQIHNAGVAVRIFDPKLIMLQRSDFD